MLYDPTYETEQSIDLRSLPPQQRHMLIFGAFDRLGADASLVLVNDHDPWPLRRQFEAVYASTFSWDYLDKGPRVWRVRIGKIASPGRCGVEAVEPPPLSTGAHR